MDADLQAMCSIMEEHFLRHPDSHRESKVCITLAAFYIFHKRAADYAKLPAASLPNIQQRLGTLFSTEAILAAPECPELENDQDDICIVLFQKINRYLFEELDSILEQYLKAEIHDVSTVSSLLTLPSKILLPLSSLSAPRSNVPELPVPPIEWAVNILEQLDYTLYLNLESPPSVCEWMKMIIDKYYGPTSLIHYLQLGWNAVLRCHFEVTMFPTGTPGRARFLDTFIDRLRNTMCYPARVSILTSTFA